jgi:hypothetical protein
VTDAAYIKIKNDSTPISWAEDGLVCADGSLIPADIVIFATGFNGNVREEVAKIFEEEVAAQAGDLWGFDEEGELRGAFKPTGREYFFLSACLLFLS